MRHVIKRIENAIGLRKPFDARRERESLKTFFWNLSDAYQGRKIEGSKSYYPPELDTFTTKAEFDDFMDRLFRDAMAKVKARRAGTPVAVTSDDYRCPDSPQS